MIDEANRIKARLEQCKTASDVETVASEERANVAAMMEHSPEAKTLAIQIVNLKRYHLWCLQNPL